MRKTTEEELIRAREEAEEATRLKDKFVSLVAHDLKSPFVVILGFLNLMLADKSQPLHPKHREMARRALAQGGGLLNMLDELLDISRLQTGQLLPKRRFLDACFMAKEAIQHLKPQAETKGINLICQVPKHTRVYADSDLLRRVLMNLLSNSIKFCREGDTISIETGRDREAALIVRDTGVGIKKERQKDLFKFEEKTSTPGTRGEKGTGLGLPFCNEIILAHGGSLDFESAPKKGTTFFLRLPHTRPTIMVVDDDPFAIQLMRSNFAPLDMELLASKSGEDALDRIEATPPHLIICDIIMPVMDGFEFLSRLRSHPMLKGIPVILMTAAHGKDTRAKALLSGANDFMSKPIKSDNLIPSIRKQIGMGLF